MLNWNKTAENGEKNYNLYKEKSICTDKDLKKFLVYINRLKSGNASMKGWKLNQQLGKKEKDNS